MKVRIILFALLVVCVQSCTVICESLSIEDAVAVALENNPEIRAAELKADAAAARIAEARAGGMPQLTLGYSYIHLDEAPTLDVPPIDINLDALATALNGYFSAASQQLTALGAPGLPAFPTQMSKTLTLPGFELAKQDTRRFTLDFKFPIYTGGRVKHGSSQARHATLALDLLSQEKRCEVALSVSSAYLAYSLALKAERVNEQALATIRNHVEQAQALFDAGLIPRYDLMRAETEQANQEHKLIEAKNQANLAGEFLLDLMGSPEMGLFEPSTPLAVDDVESVDFDELLARALNASILLAALKEKRELEKAAVRSARAERLPVVAVVASHELRDEDLSVLTPEQYVGVVVQAPIFDGGRSKARASYHRSEVESIDSQIERLENGIRLQAKKYYLDLTAAATALEASEQNIDLAKESLRLAIRRYEVGEGASIEVTDAVLAESIAETNHARACYQYIIATMGIMKVDGSILQYFDRTGR